MRLKLDEHIPVRLVPVLQDLGHDAESVFSEGLSGCDDGTLLRAAHLEQRLLITQDLDFSDRRHLEANAHSGILLLRLRTPSPRALSNRVISLLTSEPIDTWTGALVIASDHKVRVQRLEA